MNWMISFTVTLTIVFSLGLGNAHAHSKKEATEPADGAVLSAAPEMIGMNFDGPMRVTLLLLTDQDGTELDVTRTDNMQPVTAFTAQPPDLPVGQYTVEWRGLAEDGHPMQGAFSFEVSN